MPLKKDTKRACVVESDEDVSAPSPIKKGRPSRQVDEEEFAHNLDLVNNDYVNETDEELTDDERQAVCPFEEYDSDSDKSYNGDRENLEIREIPDSEAEIEDGSDEDVKKTSEKLSNIALAEAQGLSHTYVFDQTRLTK